MDLALVPILLSFIFSIFFSLYCLLNLFKPRGKIDPGCESLETPPGSTGWPVIGETLEYMSAGRKSTKEKFIEERVKKYSSKTFKTSLFGETMVLFCSAEGNKFLFSNEDKLVKSWWPRAIDVIFGTADRDENISDEYKKARLLVYPYLKPDALQKYVEIMDSVTKQHLQTYWNDKEVIKVHPLTQHFTFTLACRLLLGIEDQGIVARLEKQFVQLIAGSVSLPINLPGTNFNRAIKASKILYKEIEDIVKQWKLCLLENEMAAHSSQAILLDLLRKISADGKSINDSAFAYMTLGVIFAAYSTTSSAMASIIICLAELPNVHGEVLREQIEIANSKAPQELLNWRDVQKMKYSWNVCCEVLRLHPPATGAFKEAITDFTYDGYLIPKGWKIFWNTYATHMNPKYFPNPRKFDASRFEGNALVPFSFIPFGGGPRTCPGAEYARTMILVFMHNVVTKFKWEKVIPDEKIVSNPDTKPSKGLPVRLYPSQL